MARYTDQFRADAVLMLQAAGYPDTEGALTRVAEHLGIHARTLSRWFNKESNPPPDNIVTEQKFTLMEAINREIALIFGEMENVRETASYKDLATAAAILIDKKQLLSGEATSRAELKGQFKIDDAREQLTHLINRHASRIGTPGDSERPN